MSINWNTLDNATYEMLRWKLFASVEESGDPKSTAYIDSKGIPTIGVGFNLREAVVRDAVLQSLGFRYVENPDDRTQFIPASEEQPYVDDIVAIVNRQWSDTAAAEAVLQSQLDAVMQRRFGDEAISVSGLRPDFMYATDTEIKGTFDILIERYEARVLDEWYPDLPEFSNERIALLSLAYNARSADKDSPLTPHDDRQFPSLLGPGLRNAINDGDRAEAWYQIRYLSNKEQTKGIAKRRYIESALFGLYETSSANATPDEALSIYRMYTDHQAKILAYEREQRYQEALVNAQREGAAIGVTVSTLEQAFGPAYDQLMLEYGEDAITIDYRDIQVAAEEGSFLEGHRRDGWTLSDTAPEVNDLLIGRDGNDILDGCSGENWLYGGEGDDTYTLKGDGNSINHIIDNDGNNRLILNGSVVADAIEAGNGTWTSLDGRFSFTRNSPLTITDNQTGDTIIVADHQDGEYGIHLRENANLQRIYGKKIHGDLDPQDFAPVAIANSGGHALNWRTAA